MINTTFAVEYAAEIYEVSLLSWAYSSSTHYAIKRRYHWFLRFCKAHIYFFMKSVKFLPWSTYHSPVTLVILCTKMHVLPSSHKLSHTPCNGYKTVWHSLFYVLALLWNCCRDGLASLETNKQQFNRSGFVKTARVPNDCVQIQLDECVQIKYLSTRHMGQSAWLLKICVQKKNGLHLRK